MSDKKLSEALRDLSRIDLPPDEVLRRHDAVVHAAARLEAEVKAQGEAAIRTINDLAALREVQSQQAENQKLFSEALAALRERVERIEIELSGRDPIPGAPFVPPAPEREERWDDKYGRYFVPPAPRKEERCAYVYDYGDGRKQECPYEKRQHEGAAIHAFVPPRPEAQGEKAWSEIEMFPARERRTWTNVYSISHFINSAAVSTDGVENITVVEVFPGETLGPQQEGEIARIEHLRPGRGWMECRERATCKLDKHRVLVVLPEGSAAKEGKS